MESLAFLHCSPRFRVLWTRIMTLLYYYYYYYYYYYVLLLRSIY